MTKKTTEEELKTEELDSARASILIWSTTPPTETGKHSSANLNGTMPFPFSLARSIFNLRAQYATAKFKIPEEGEFNPKVHYTIEADKECLFGKKLMDNLLAGTVAVSGNRAKLVLETTKDIGRPQQNLMGQMLGMLGKSQELESPEEVPSYE